MFVVIVLLLWTFLSILNQFIFFRKKMNWFNLLPVWTYFTPNPTPPDYRLLYRTKSNNLFSSWKEIRNSKFNSNLKFIWHPTKRYRKLVSTSTSNLVSEIINLYGSEISGFDYSLLELRLPYKIILSIMFCESKQIDVNYFGQFLIVRRMETQNKTKEVKIIFKSKSHQYLC